MSDLATVRAALLEMVATVPAIGRVHDRARYVRLPSDMLRHYIYAPPDGVEHVRGWHLQNTAIEERTLARGRVLNKFDWQLRGYMSFSDELASELVFDELVEGVRAVFRADPTLGGVCSAEAYGEQPDGMQKADAAPVMFCGVLCHSAVLTCSTWKYTSKT